MKLYVLEIEAAGDVVSILSSLSMSNLGIFGGIIGVYRWSWTVINYDQNRNINLVGYDSYNPAEWSDMC